MSESHSPSQARTVCTASNALKTSLVPPQHRSHRAIPDKNNLCEERYVSESVVERNIDRHTTAFIVRRSLRYKRKYMNVSVATIPERLRNVVKRGKV